MKDNRVNQEPESLTPGIFSIPGEPAVLINGVPSLAPSPPETTPATSNTSPETLSPRHPGFGEWLVGRAIKKQFGDQLYSGTVTEYDRETGWYRAVYEDGDFEDLEWLELRDVLEPLDVSVPLRSLALKVIRRNEKVDLAVVGREGKTAYKAKSGESVGKSSRIKRPFCEVSVVLALRAPGG